MILLDILGKSVDVFVEMAPYLLVGFALAGVLYVLVPKSWVTRHLGGRGLWAVIKGATVGIPLPLCSCGVIPFASSLTKQGAGRGPTTAFLIATPQTGADSILVTYSFLGLPFALYRVIAALLTGVAGGTLAATVDRSTPPTEAEIAAQPPVAQGIGNKAKAAFRFGLDETVRDVAVWLLVGIVLAGMIEALLPPQSLSPQKLGGSFASMLAVVFVAVPMYVCATASVPIAAALVAKGMPLGAALVFLVAGPATNAATLSIFAKTLGKRTAVIYVGTIVGFSVALGWVFEKVFAGARFAEQVAHHHHESAWWMTASAFVLAVLVARALFLVGRERLARLSDLEIAEDAPRTDLSVPDMNCDNCRRHVEEAVHSIAPEAVVQVDLEERRASVLGQTPGANALLEALAKAGYPAELLQPATCGCSSCG